MSEPGVPPPPPYNPPPPLPPSGAGPGVSPNRSLMIILSYLGPLAVIPLLVEKDDREVQWHAKHGLVIFAAFLILGFAFNILSRVFDIGCLGCLPGASIGTINLVIAVLCILKGLKGERFLIPGISDFANRF
jgi:uncharacterized membrane protein